MGCVPNDTECEADEKPQHPVKITKGFWMSSTAVTVTAYKRFVEATSHQMLGLIKALKITMDE